MITKKQVEHIANLARLKFSEKEKEKFSKELSQILDFVEKLNEVDTSKIEPFFSEGIKNVVRKDMPKNKKLEIRNKLLKEVPDKEDNLIKTKPIF